VRGGSRRLLRHLSGQIGRDAMTDPDSRPPFRADHVGSLLRSKKLIDAHQAQIAGKLPAADLSAIEDEEIRNAVAIQERVESAPLPMENCGATTGETASLNASKASARSASLVPSSSPSIPVSNVAECRFPQSSANYGGANP